MGAVFVYDVQNEFSLYNLGQWRQTLNSFVIQRDKKPIPSIMVGNKVSLLSYSSLPYRCHYLPKPNFYITLRSKSLHNFVEVHNMFVQCSDFPCNLYVTLYHIWVTVTVDISIH